MGYPAATGKQVMAVLVQQQFWFSLFYWLSLQ